MAKLRYSGEEVESEEGETVLQALRRHGLEVSSSCEAGVCQACMLCCVQGSVPAAAQAGLRASLKEKGYFLACQCVAEGPMQLSLGALTPTFQPATLVSRDELSARIKRLRLLLESPLEFRAGQFVSLRRADGLIRSYSIACLPSDEAAGQSRELELHVARVPDGRMSQWLCHDLEVGRELEIRGPCGDCCYAAETLEQPLLLVATGSGLAPILGVLRSALKAGHKGEIHLYHGGRDPGGLYLVGELQEFSAEHSNFHYYPCISGEACSWAKHSRASDLALSDHKQLTGWQVYLCGNADMVKKTKTLAYLAGAGLDAIFADAFEFAAQG